MTQEHEVNHSKFRTHPERAMPKPGQVENPSELVLGKHYVYHHSTPGEAGKPDQEVTMLLKFHTLNNAGANFVFKDFDGEPRWDTWPLAELGLAPFFNGQWTTNSWLEDPTKKA